MSTSTPQTFPDPDDFDDLDDVLDQFTPNLPPTTTIPPAPPPTATASGAGFDLSSLGLQGLNLGLGGGTSGRPRTNTRVEGAPPDLGEGETGDDELSREFSKELMKGMESLMLEIAGEASAKGKGKGEGGEGEKDLLKDEETVKAFQAAWEAMLVEGMDGMTDVDALVNATPKAKTKELRGETGFQSQIKQTMEHLKRGEEQLHDSPAAPDTSSLPPDFQSFLASLASSSGSLDGLDLDGLGLGEGAEGDVDEDKLSAMLDGLLDNLFAKEVLYEPIKEICVAYPPYLASPPSPLSDADKERYEKQLEVAKKIVAVFERPGYSDKDDGCKGEITGLMEEMQNYGSPPAEVVGPLPMPGQDGEGCVVA